MSTWSNRMRRGVTLAAAIILTSALATVGLAAPAGAQSATRTVSGAGVVQYPVTFTVQNVNHSKVSCSSDGQTYQVHGHITGTAQALASPVAATLLLHGLSYGEFFGDFTAVDGYNFADKQASAGHVTVTIDRLGYGASDKPKGQGDCIGSQADVAHQIVTQLKSGHYDTSGAASASFPKIVLAGHSVGGLIAQVEAYSFGDIDGLMVLSYSDTKVSVAAMGTLATATSTCQAGGVRQSAGGPSGYVPFGDQQAADFVAAHFYPINADPKVVSAVAAKRSLDPCGDILSYKTAVAADAAHLGEVKVPALVLIGAQDAIYPTPATTQAALLTGSQDVTPITLASTAHALTFHYTADEFSADLAAWLTSHDFGGWAIPVGAPDTGGGSTAATSHPALVSAGVALLALAGLTMLYAVRRRRNPSAG